ncbi:hypothetical protein BJ165DRAFT_362262 [Panaeolus papilionaceus]|nr:hypothetical protein BJ165DRAFT_362262 [Panaeolus papilionaceus]
MSLIPSATSGESPHPHTPDSIRAATLQLSNMPFPASFTSMTLGGGPASFRSIHSGQSRTQTQQATPSEATPADKGPTDPSAEGFIFPETLLSPLAQASSTDLAIERGDHEIDETYLSHSMASSFLRDVPSSRTSAIGESSGLDSSISTLQSSDGKTSEATPPPSVTSSSERKKPSGLSLLRPAGEDGPESSSRSSSLSSGESRRPPPPHLAAPQYRDSAGPGSRLVSEVVPTAFHPVRSPSYLDSTPTASPSGTPRPPFQRNLSAQYMGALPASHPPAEAPSAATQYHVRWRSPPSLVRALEPSPAPSRSQSRTRHASTRVSAHETTPLIAGGEVNYHTGVVNGDHGKHNLSGRHASSLGESSEGDDESDDVERGWSSGTGTGYRGYGSGDDGTDKRLGLGLRLRESVKGGVGFVKDRVKKEVKLAPAHANTAVKAIPAVLLGALLNVLDGISYGMIIFPATGVFAGLGPMGVSMFFVSTVVAQLTYTLGGSGFAGANGSMMIEVVPFFHILATSIAAQMGEDDPGAVIATTFVAYAFSSVLTGTEKLLWNSRLRGT